MHVLRHQISTVGDDDDVTTACCSKRGGDDDDDDDGIVESPNGSVIGGSPLGLLCS